MNHECHVDMFVGAKYEHAGVFHTPLDEGHREGCGALQDIVADFDAVVFGLALLFAFGCCDCDFTAVAAGTGAGAATVGSGTCK